MRELLGLARRLLLIKVLRRGFGTKGIRDPEALCTDFDSGSLQLKDFPQCHSDGHYLCLTCKWYRPDLEFILDGEGKND